MVDAAVAIDRWRAGDEVAMDKRDDPATERARRAWEARAAEWRRGMVGRDEVLGDATELLLDLAGVGPGSRVLDVAAGTGDQTLCAARRVGPTGTVLAIDIAAGMLAGAADAAREAGLTNVATRVMDAQRLDLEPGSFDAAICRNALMHLADLQGALTGIRRALRPGGRLASMVFSLPEHNPFFALPVAIARRHAGLPPDDPRHPRGKFALSLPGALERAYRTAGFRDVTVRAVPLRQHFPSLAEFIRMRQGMGGSPRDLLEQLGEEDRARAWGEIEAAFRRYETSDGLVLPGEMLLAAGAS